VKQATRKPDWRHSFEVSRQRFEREILAARLRGQTTYQFGDTGRLLDPTRLSRDKLAILAREHAARVTDRAINKWNEQNGS
jgi:hypothetical protein